MSSEFRGRTVLLTRALLLARTPLVAAVAVAVAGCGSSSAPSAGKSPTHFTEARFAPSNFSNASPSPNMWLPLRPGTQWVRVGTTDVGHRPVPHQVISTVTGVTRRIDGIQAIAVLDRDVDAGQIAQQSLDWFAQDRQGNVWQVGAYTEEYEGGRFVSVRDAWLGGVKGGQPGIMMAASPSMATPPYSIARPPGADPDAAQIVATGRRQCVPLRCFEGVLVIREGKASALDNEFKYYAPGVGQILNAPRSQSKHHDVEQLVNLTQVSRRGLAELSAEALKLDRHARITKPDVFGRSPGASQAR